MFLFDFCQCLLFIILTHVSRPIFFFFTLRLPRRPNDPIEWLATYLLKNNPNKKA